MNTHLRRLRHIFPARRRVAQLERDLADAQHRHRSDAAGITRLQAELDQARRQAATLTSQVDELHRHNEQLYERLADTEEALAEREHEATAPVQRCIGVNDGRARFTVATWPYHASITGTRHTTLGFTFVWHRRDVLALFRGGGWDFDHWAQFVRANSNPTHVASAELLETALREYGLPSHERQDLIDQITDPTDTSDDVLELLPGDLDPTMVLAPSPDFVWACSILAAVAADHDPRKTSPQAAVSA